MGSFLRLTSCSLFIFALGCTNNKKDSSSSSDSRYLYVASGSCYSGAGNTTFTNLTSSNLVYRINLSTGLRDSIIADYVGFPAQTGDSPVSIASIDSDRMYVLVENPTTASARRIEIVNKKTSTFSTFTNNITVLSAALRSLKLLSSGDMLISKSTAIEKLSGAGVRITKGANPYVNAPGGSCVTSTTLHSRVTTLSNGKIVFLHAAASQNRFGIISASGYGTAADCLSAQAAPIAAASPVAVAYDSAHGKLLVAYAGNATTDNINSIYSYDIDESTNAITNAQEIYDAVDYPATYPYLLYGISEMVLDTENSHLYVATAISSATTVVNYAIEKFSYDSSKIGVSNSQVLTRVGSVPFYEYGFDTKCISNMIIAD